MPRGEELRFELMENGVNGIDWEKLWEEVQGQFRGSLMGIHGLGHWRQVERNGVMLATENGLGEEGIVVVRLFAILHDSQRVNDGWDKEHGARAAAFARTVRGTLFEVEDRLFEKVERACAGHELGRVTEDGLIGACWDADRLDLVRLGVMVDPRLMSTVAGKRLAPRWR
jgi:uncharacterized protein